MRDKNIGKKRKSVKNPEKSFLAILRQRLLAILLLLIQCAIFVLFIVSNSEFFDKLQTVLVFISVLVALNIITSQRKRPFRAPLVFIIMFVPVFGGLLYLFFEIQTSGKTKIRKRWEEFERKNSQLTKLPQVEKSQVNKRISEHKCLVRYLEDRSDFPVFDETETTYFSLGEEKFDALMREIKSAKKYIFMEYFIISEGYMWDEIVTVLKEKAAQGVDVRIVYDDVGCFFRMPANSPKKLRKDGIKCAVFNPYKVFVTTILNNRDHRKIAIIDGKTAFTGGVNIADEYINRIERFGHWKDTSVMVRGDAVVSFVVMFLQMWYTCTGVMEDYEQYIAACDTKCESDGFVQPYSDTPLDNEAIGEHVFMHIITSAKKYLYITTPYLIIDDSMISALAFAAKGGVDVKIITPHIWDKKVVHETTRSYYRELIDNGIKIYEYTPGFIHAKSMVADDSIAVIGTTNLDFRSLYLHFECGVILYDTGSVKDCRDDFAETLSKSEIVTKEQCAVNPFARLYQEILRLFAPLM